MKKPKQDFIRVQKLLRDIFAEVGDFQFRSDDATADSACDLAITSKESKRPIYIQVKARERITPQIAEDLFKRVLEEAPDRVVCLLYAPVISPRVADLAREYGVSYLDSAGNCRIVDRKSGLLISRKGILNEEPRQKQGHVDPFSTRSSRVIRVMLHEPNRGWQVTELAEHPDVDVSVGLAFKVKDALVRESYAVVRNRLIYLKRPLDLLIDWSRKYPGPSEQRQFYVRGETEAIESKVVKWCEEAHHKYALARFSAAWRHAPEVRYSTASLYVAADAFRLEELESLRAATGAREVESGANLILLTPFDDSVFVRASSTPEQTTSPLQTYLDLKLMTGRGTEAAEAVFEKHLRT